MPASFPQTDLERKKLQTACGSICYWVAQRRGDLPNLVFLPGLTADHRLFDDQVKHFAPRARCLV